MGKEGPVGPLRAPLTAEGLTPARPCGRGFPSPCPPALGQRPPRPRSRGSAPAAPAGRGMASPLRLSSLLAAGQATEASGSDQRLGPRSLPRVLPPPSQAPALLFRVLLHVRAPAGPDAALGWRTSATVPRRQSPGRAGGSSVGEHVASASHSIASSFGVPSASPVPRGAWVETPPQLPTRLSWPGQGSVWRIQPAKASFSTRNPRGSGRSPLPPPLTYSPRQIQGHSAPQGARGTV